MKTHWKKLKNPKYFGSHDLLGESQNLEINVTLSKVVKEMVDGADGKKEECMVAYLINQKPLILNVTNAKTIQKIANSPFIEDWAGLKVCLFVKRVKAFGDMVDAIRVKEARKETAKPELKEDTEQFDKSVAALKQGYKISDIKRKYTVSAKVEALLIQKGGDNA